MKQHIDIVQLCREYWRDKIDLEGMDEELMSEDDDYAHEHWQQALTWLRRSRPQPGSAGQPSARGDAYDEARRRLTVRVDQERAAAFPFLRVSTTLVSDVNNPAHLNDMVNALTASGQAICYWNSAFDSVLLEARVPAEEFEWGEEPPTFNNWQLFLAEHQIAQIAAWVAPVMAERAGAYSCWPSTPTEPLPGLLAPTPWRWLRS